MVEALIGRMFGEVGGESGGRRLFHAVADARLGEDVFGFVGIVAEFLAQSFDDGADQTRVARVALVPDPLQQLVVGHHPTGIGR